MKIPANQIRADSDNPDTLITSNWNHIQVTLLLFYQTVALLKRLHFIVCYLYSYWQKYTAFLLLNDKYEKYVSFVIHTNIANLCFVSL